jgi:hypothetical protein
MVLAISALLLSLSVAVIVVTTAWEPLRERAPIHIGRFCLELALLYGVYRGSEFARWSLAVLLGLAAALAVLMWRSLEEPFFFGFTFGYLILIVLVASGRVSAFLRGQRIRHGTAREQELSDRPEAPDALWECPRCGGTTSNRSMSCASCGYALR